MKKIILLLLLITCSSCGLIAKKIYKIKQPKDEDAISIKSFLLKNNVDTSNIYVFNSEKSFVNYSQLKTLTIPGAVFFNKEGNNVEYNKTASSCTKNITTFLDGLKSFSEKETTNNFKIEEVLKLIKPISKINKTYEADINVFILWTVYIGKLNDENTYEWIKLINKAKSEGLRINYYLLNCDTQKEWTSNYGEKSKVKIN
jgi:hypothetical protein